MKLKKREILKLLPKISQMKRDLKIKRRQAAKLTLEADELNLNLVALDNVVLYEGFPMRITTYNGNVEVRSACSDSMRYGYATRIGKTKLYTVNIYKGTSKEDDGIPVEGEHTHYASLRMMKSWVAYGKLGRVPRRRTKV
jgi:hypothetical protein